MPPFTIVCAKCIRTPDGEFRANSSHFCQQLCLEGETKKKMANGWRLSGCCNWACDGNLNENQKKNKMACGNPERNPSIQAYTTSTNLIQWVCFFFLESVERNIRHSFAKRTVAQTMRNATFHKSESYTLSAIGAGFSTDHAVNGTCHFGDGMKVLADLVNSFIPMQCTDALRKARYNEYFA